jgi:hypothetical protein
VETPRSRSGNSMEELGEIALKKKKKGQLWESNIISTNALVNYYVQRTVESILKGSPL